MITEEEKRGEKNSDAMLKDYIATLILSTVKNKTPRDQCGFEIHFKSYKSLLFWGDAEKNYKDLSDEMWNIHHLDIYFQDIPAGSYVLIWEDHLSPHIKNDQLPLDNLEEFSC